VHIFGLRLNMYIASILAIIGAVWFYRIQRRPAAPDPAPDDAGPVSASGDATVSADAAVSDEATATGSEEGTSVDAAVPANVTVTADATVATVSAEASAEPSGNTGEPRDSGQTAS
jgi:hypothetical protein